MNTPNLTNEKKDWTRWNPVVSGQESPDEWQSAMIEQVQNALAAGLFYSSDVRDYVKNNAEFVPPSFWDLQYEKQPVEGGVMGMECYMARNYLRETEERKANADALARLHEGKKLGSLCINGKRYNANVITEIKDGRVYVAGKAGRYDMTFDTTPAAIETMIERAIQRGWRKS